MLFLWHSSSESGCSPISHYASSYIDFLVIIVQLYSIHLWAYVLGMLFGKRYDHIFRKIQ